MDRTHDQEGPKAAQPLIFGLDIPAITHLIDAYKNRTFAEDLEIIRNMEDADGILRLLHVNADTGLQSNSNLEARAMHFGDNKRAERKNTSFLMLCWDALGDFTMRLLLVIGTFQLFLGIFYSKHPEHEWMEGFAILIAVVVVVLVTAVNDYQKQKKFSQLQESYKNRQGVRVLRDGNYQMMNPQDILVGDILMIENGLIIPADGVLLTANSMMVDEAAMTGENDQIQKSSIQESMKLWENYLLENPKFDPKHLHGDYHHTLTSPIILSGTTLSAGSGRMVVLAVGPNSAEGRILTLSTQEESETPLQRKLNKIARDISKVGLACGILAIVILFTRFFIELGIGTISWDTQDHVKELTDYILIGITILVVAIPEGLPLAVAISLAYSVKKMQKDNNLVKKMHACETMGGADMICSDKTGTLTTNNMTVANFMLERTIHDFETTKPSSSTFPHEYFAILKETICVNSSASVTDSGEDGSKTEIAMLKMLKAMGHDDYEQVRRIYESRFHRIFPFSSERKRSSIVISLDEESTRRRVHVKGASEIVFDLCTSILNERGQAQNLESSQKEMLLEMILGMNRRGLRTICLAYANLDPRFDIESVDANDFPMVELQPLTCIGIVGIKDPVREGVPQAVRNCKRAHIRVRMITGDNEITARAIAEECQIIVHGQSDQNCVITGKAFNDLVGGTVCKNCRTEKCGCTRDPKEVTDQVKFRVDVVGNMEKFKEIIERIDVMARSRPEDKYTMVTGLNELGHVVAVTGDGTNDAPALRKADIGFAMGIQGTMLARETADIVLLDDNFASIVVAVKWGRNIYDNIRRFIQFQLTVNVVAVSCAIIGGVTIKQSPLTPVQMMWVNLIMDTFASLALATDEPREELLDRFPQKRTESIVSKLMWKHIYGQAFLQTLIVCVMMFVGEYFLPEFSDGERALKSYDNEDLIRQGRDYHLDGEIDYKDDYDNPDIGPSRHFTYIFNVFVFMQLFNEFNARRIQDEVNVFQGITKNWLFIGIWLFTALTQVLMVSVGGYAFSCHLDGLTIEQWFISIGIAILCLPWRLVLLLIPSKIFMEYGNEELDLHTQSAGALIVRRSTNSINRRNSITPL